MVMHDHECNYGLISSTVPTLLSCKHLIGLSGQFANLLTGRTNEFRKLKKANFKTSNMYKYCNLVRIIPTYFTYPPAIHHSSFSPLLLG